jgi:peptide/nickel transport system substrate-binding protein
MMPKRLASTDPFQQIPEVVGSGPFTFAKDQWVPGSKIVYLKNKDYVPRTEAPSGIAGGKVVKVDRVEWVVLPDNQTAASALQRGEVDFFEQPPTDLLPMLRTSKGVKVEVLNPLGTEGILRLNHIQPPFNNPKVRQAMLWIVNQKDYLQAMIGDPQLSKTCGAILVCGSSMGSEAGADALIATISDDQRIQKAKALLTEGGYKGELAVLLDPAERQRFHAANLVLADAMKKAGMNVRIDAMDWGTLVTRRAKKEPADQGGWSAFHTSSGGLEASNPAFHIADSAGCEKAWFGWPCDAEVEKLRTQWALARSLPERQKIAEALQKRMMEVVVYIPYGQWSSPVAYRDNLKGLIAVPDSIVWWNVEKM